MHPMLRSLLFEHIRLVSFFFSVIRRPPIYTLFPYTTLFRSIPIRPEVTTFPLEDANEALERLKSRSEEHTSELQSLTNLVCRLLLEKKKPSQEGDKVQAHQDLLTAKSGRTAPAPITKGERTT